MPARSKIKSRRDACDSGDVNAVMNRVESKDGPPCGIELTAKIVSL